MSEKVFPRPPASLPCILLVDDEARNLEALEALLTSPEYQIVKAGTAEEALMAVLQRDFATILMDVRMPGMDGIEIARRIKDRKRSHGIPIMFLTAHAPTQTELLLGYNVGAVDYLTKPVDAKILKTKIAVFVDLFNKRSELIETEELLRIANAELEARVSERTEKLSQANEDLQRSSEAVQERESRYQQLIANLPVAVYTTDAEGRITLCNEAAVKLWSRTPAIGKEMWCGSYKIFRPDGTELPLNECPMAVTLKQGHAIRGQEILIERPDGTRRNVLPYPDPLLDGSGKLVGAINMLLDITEAKKAELGLRRLAAIVESSDDAIISKNLNSIIISWNQGAERIFGYTAEEVIGRPVTILMPPERWNEEPQILDRIRRGERIEHYETTRQRKDGSLIEISLTVSPLKDADGKVLGVSKIVRDVTAQKRAERELAKAHAEITSASRAKDDFLAALSHELRTPLNPVLLIASDAAEDPEFSEHVRSKFSIIRKNIELEARLIDDLLDITRISHGKLSLNMEEVDIHAVLELAIEMVQSEFAQKQVNLALRPVNENVRVKADPVRVQQIFWNILKNAVKFSPRGGRVEIVTEISQEGKIRICITDNGIGLTDDEIKSIFNAFSQGEHAAHGGSQRFGGLGLGLTISRMLVELHSGQIKASSEGRGRGSTFAVELPLLTVQDDNDQLVNPAVDRTAENVRTRPAALGIRILLVEDHEPTRTALTHLLARRKHDVLPAISLAEARRIASQEKLDVVISDIGLPDGDGYALMAELKHAFGLKGIALTGYGMEQDVKRGKDAGFIAHLVKPIRIENLEDVLSLIQHHRSAH